MLLNHVKIYKGNGLFSVLMNKIDTLERLLRAALQPENISNAKVMLEETIYLHTAINHFAYYFDLIAVPLCSPSRLRDSFSNEVVELICMRAKDVIVADHIAKIQIILKLNS